MTLEVRSNLSKAVEIGRWPDGTKLSDEQRKNSMQAIIAWDSVHGEKTDEPFRVQKGGEFNSLANKKSVHKNTSTKATIPVKSLSK